MFDPLVRITFFFRKNRGWSPSYIQSWCSGNLITSQIYGEHDWTSLKSFGGWPIWRKTVGQDGKSFSKSPTEASMFGTRGQGRGCWCFWGWNRWSYHPEGLWSLDMEKLIDWWFFSKDGPFLKSPGLPKLALKLHEIRPWRHRVCEVWIHNLGMACESFFLQDGGNSTHQLGTSIWMALILTFV